MMSLTAASYSAKHTLKNKTHSWKFFMFNDEGYLPAGIHDMTVVEIRTKLVDTFPSSKTRSVIFEGYEKHRSELEAIAIDIEQLIDGSFTSEKIDPNDIDLVCFANANVVDSLPDDKKQALMNLLKGHATVASYYCDAYFCPTLPDTDPLYPKLRTQRKYWMGEFGYDRLDKPKGLVRTQLNPSKKS